MTSVCLQIRTRPSETVCWSSSSSFFLCSLWVRLSSCAGTSCCGDSGWAAGRGRRDTSESEHTHRTWTVSQSECSSVRPAVTPPTELSSLPLLRADGAASANPSRGPPPRVQPPSVARGNTNNIVREGVSRQDVLWRLSVSQTELQAKCCPLVTVCLITS